MRPSNQNEMILQLEVWLTPSSANILHALILVEHTFVHMLTGASPLKTDQQSSGSSCFIKSSGYPPAFSISSVGQGILWQSVD
jgi:hypothetical protein